jgi:hypothetical protein
VESLFAIEFGSYEKDQVFEGLHNPEYRWNGWATPMFTKQVADKVKSAFTSVDYPIYYEHEVRDDWEGLLIYKSSMTSPKGEPLYEFDGWCWDEVERGRFSKNRFTIDGVDLSFEGYYNPNHRWNGWATPMFKKSVIDAIILSFTTEDEPLCFTDNASLTKYEVNGEPLYTIDSWCWEVEG